MAATSLPAGALGQSYYWSAFAGLPPQSGYIDGIGSDARFNVPVAIAADAEGNLYVADASNQVIRVVSVSGKVTTLAGLAGHRGTADGNGAAARFNSPSGIALSRGSIFIADASNHTVRRVGFDGGVTTYAGAAGQSGATDGPAALARFNQPLALAADAVGNLYVADTGNHTIRRISVDGQVSTVAGAAGQVGTADGVADAARFNRPEDVAASDDGTLYVADTGNHSIRRISPDRQVRTVGLHDAVGADVTFDFPQGIAILADGTLIVVDSAAESLRAVSADGEVSLYAGRLGVRGSREGIRTDARFYSPTRVATTPDGAIVVADTGNNNIRRIAADGTVTTLAGPEGNFGRTDGTGTNVAFAARFNFPWGVTVAKTGDVYLADSRGNTIRRISAEGAVVTLVGSGSNDYRDGAAAVASVNYPVGVAAAQGGGLYFCEEQLHTIRLLNPDGTVSTVAGIQGSPGWTDGAAASARFNYPSGIVRDTNGDLYIADKDNHVIRRIAADTNNVTTFAGMGGVRGAADGPAASAQFSFPSGLAFDAAGNLYVADTDNGTIRKIARGIVSTVAGTPMEFGATDGDVSVARFFRPTGICVDASGQVYVADPVGHNIRLVTGNTVSTIGGRATLAGYADGTNGEAEFLEPDGIAVDANGKLYVSDAGNNLVMRGAPEPNFVAATAGHISNLSIRATAGGHAPPLLVGFVIGGFGQPSLPLLIRGVGPSLAQFGVSALLSDPALAIIQNGAVIAANDNWSGDANVTAVNARLGAFPFPTPSSLDAALYNAGLPAGSYSVQISAVGGAGGVVLAELYDASTGRLSLPTGTRLTNVSARTHVGQGTEALIAGFTIDGGTSKRVLIRAIGPGLVPFGVTDALPDPKLEVFSGTTKLYENDNWSGTTLAAVADSLGAFALPAGSRDSAMLVTLAPGGYTVRVSGIGDTVGDALVEVYDVP